MQTVIIVIHLMIVSAMIGLVLLQKSEQQNRHDECGDGLRGGCDDGDEIELWHGPYGFCAGVPMNAM